MSVQRVRETATPATSHKADQVGLWLSLRMNHSLAASKPKSAYQQDSKVPRSSRPQAAPAIRQLPSSHQPSATEKFVERLGTVETIEQTIALEFFNREGSKLKATFPESELKSEFRKIAMRIHPDRHTNATSEELKSYSSRFQTLVESAEILESALK